MFHLQLHSDSVTKKQQKHGVYCGGKFELVECGVRVETPDQLTAALLPRHRKLNLRHGAPPAYHLRLPGLQENRECRSTATSIDAHIIMPGHAACTPVSGHSSCGRFNLPMPTVDIKIKRVRKWKWEWIGVGAGGWEQACSSERRRLPCSGLGPPGSRARALPPASTAEVSHLTP